MSNAPTIITGRAAVLVNKHTRFDLAEPAKTPAHEFVFAREEVIEDEKLNQLWASGGYRHVGWAELRVEVMPTTAMLSSAVSALKAEKQNVLAVAQAEATRLEGEIQKLLAIEFDGSVA